MISEMQANCKKVASVMAADSYDYARFGVPIRITNKLAIDTLAQAYEKFIKNGCKLITHRVTLKQSKAFPRNASITQTACSVVAVSYDLNTHFVYGLQYCDSPFLSEDERFEIARRAAIDEVRRHSEYAGFPISTTIGCH
jgi:hypothetical protein